MSITHSAMGASIVILLEELGVRAKKHSWKPVILANSSLSLKNMIHMTKSKHD